MWLSWNHTAQSKLRNYPVPVWALQQLKQNVWDLQQAISTRKARYAEALRRLEALSAEIHESRRSRQKLMLQFPREPGVGAESDSLGSSISDSNIGE